MSWARGLHSVRTGQKYLQPSSAVEGELDKQCDDEGASHVRLASIACLSLRGEGLAAGMASSYAWLCTAWEPPCPRPQPQTPRVYICAHVQCIYYTYSHPSVLVL